MLIDVFTGWSGPCLAVESHLRRMRNSFVEAPNCLYLGRDHLASFRFSSALAHNSMTEILSFYLPFNQYSVTININKLCCHWLKCLQKDKISVVLSYASVPEQRKETKWSRLQLEHVVMKQMNWQTSSSKCILYTVHAPL